MLVILTILLGISIVSNFIQIKKIKGEIVMALNEAVEALKVEVSAVAERVALLTGPFEAQIAELTTTIETERAAHAALIAAEDLEDVEQNATLDAAKAETDAKIAEANAAATEIHSVVGALKDIAKGEEDVPLDPETPVDPELPVDPEAPVEEPIVEDEA